MKRRLWTGAGALLGMALMILDSKTALYGASQGMELCLRTLVPSLFPFFVLSILLTAAVGGKPLPFLRPLGRLCGIPIGAEGLFLTGFLGGYPTGAQCVSQAYSAGQISAGNARRMLGFFSNAGPSFLFGIVAGRFPGMRFAWFLWGIHIASAILTGIILPGKSADTVVLKQGTAVSLPQALRKAITIMANVCGWVILSRVVIAFCSRWFLWLLPNWLQVFFVGVLDLTNGCWDLATVSPDGLRFVLCAGLLGFGGICVMMQTVSVTGNLGLGAYLPGKLIHCGLSVLMAFFAQLFLFDSSERIGAAYWEILFFVIIAVTFLTFFTISEKRSSNLREIGV